MSIDVGRVFRAFDFDRWASMPVNGHRFPSINVCSAVVYRSVKKRNDHLQALIYTSRCTHVLHVPTVHVESVIVQEFKFYF